MDCTSSLKGSEVEISTLSWPPSNGQTPRQSRRHRPPRDAQPASLRLVACRAASRSQLIQCKPRLLVIVSTGRRSVLPTWEALESEVKPDHPPRGSHDRRTHPRASSSAPLRGEAAHQDSGALCLFENRRNIDRFRGGVRT